MNNGTTRPLGHRFSQRMKERKLAFKMFEKQTREYPSYENIIKWVESGTYIGRWQFFIKFDPKNRTHVALVTDAEKRLNLDEFTVVKGKTLLKVFIPSKWA